MLLAFRGSFRMVDCLCRNFEREGFGPCDEHGWDDVPADSYRALLNRQFRVVRPRHPLYGRINRAGLRPSRRRRLLALASAGQLQEGYGTLLQYEDGVGYCAFTGNPVEW